MDEKGFLLGMSNRAKVIVRRGRQPVRKHRTDRESGLQLSKPAANNTIHQWSFTKAQFW